MAARLDDVQLPELLDLDPARGLIQLYDQRMVLQGAAAMGLLRRELVATIGAEETRRLLLRFGYADGYHDAVTLRDRFRWRDPIEGIRAGLRLHALEGIVLATADRLSSRSDGTFEAALAWHNSYEAEQHLHHLGPSPEPVCWTLVGYMSGFASGCLEADVSFRETQCVASGASHCTLVGQIGATGDVHAGQRHGAPADLRTSIERLRAASARRASRRRGVRRVAAGAVRDRALDRAEALGFVARSPAMRNALELATRVAPLDTTVLITGESGTGKEFFARTVHDESRRRSGPWVPVNCGALAETLLESELFGHVRGAFTGAAYDKAGLFEQASRGTLFLDEVSEMTPALQVRLLRALQEREIRRVGGDRTIRVDVRIVAATNRDLRADVRAGRFREDLYYRLAGVDIHIPPLRDRRDDIPLLVYRLLRQMSARCRTRVTAVSSAAMRRLTAYSWPGNVRELERAVERAVILARASTITVRDLPQEIISGVQGLAAGDLDLKRHEQRLIGEALARFGGNRRQAAAALGISTVSLWRKLRSRGQTASP